MKFLFPLEILGFPTILFSYNLNSFWFACTYKHLLAFVTVFQGNKEKEKHRNSSVCRFEYLSAKACALFSSRLFPLGKPWSDIAQMELPSLQIYNLHICVTFHFSFCCICWVIILLGFAVWSKCSSFQTWGSPGNHFFCIFKQPVFDIR